MARAAAIDVPPVAPADVRPVAPPDAEEILQALATAIVAVDERDALRHLNVAGEQLFGSSAAHLRGQPLADLVPGDNPLLALIRQVRDTGMAITEYGIALDSPRIGRHYVNAQATPLAERPGWVVLALHERSVADRIDRQLTHRGAARSVGAMAAMLAHEVKNPLSGIRGAAQLLEQSVTPEDRVLTTLVRDEVDRICALVDRMEVFAEQPPARHEAVNIHRVLDHVRRLAENGFAAHVRFGERYDPSLPPVLGNRDQLIQVFLNLVKNAAEAVPARGGEVILETAYKQGVRFAVPGRGGRVHLPLMVSVQDNGDGIPEDIRGQLFDPFVTSKRHGSGLGMALVAKIIDDHGGVIEFESRPRRTVFRAMLPTAPPSGKPNGEDGP